MFVLIQENYREFGFKEGDLISIEECNSFDIGEVMYYLKNGIGHFGRYVEEFSVNGLEMFKIIC